MAIRVAIAGATGYTGEELIRLLLRHPQVQLTYLAASAKWEKPVHVSDVFPRFARQLDLPLTALDPTRLATVADVVFLALPHGEAMALATQLLNAGKRVIDLSGDFRLQDPTLYPRWYKFEHRHPELLRDARVTYGLTEFHRDDLRNAQLVANPGCYATSILLGILPLFRAGLVGGGSFIVDAKSGLSGAGRKADPSLLFSEMTENLRAYKVNDHQHTPEVLQELKRLSGRSAEMVFVPQVIPVKRGLISMMYIKTEAVPEQIAGAYQHCYHPESDPFIRVRSNSLPTLHDVVETNYCDIGFVHHPSTKTAIVISALDNLTKGAAGQAVQNLNAIMGWPETTGLLP